MLLNPDLKSVFAPSGLPGRIAATRRKLSNVSPAIIQKTRSVLASAGRSDFGDFLGDTMSEKTNPKISAALAKIFSALKHSKLSEQRLQAARDIKQYVSTLGHEMSKEKFNRFMGDVNRLIFELVHSSDPNEKLGGIVIIDELMDIDGEDSGTKVTRANYLRIVLGGSDSGVMKAASQALGHLALAGGTLTADIVEFEVKRALEWLQGMHMHIHYEKWEYDPKLHATLRGHKAPISAIAFAPDGKFLATASQDCRLVLWDTEQEEHEQRHVALQGHEDAIHVVHVSSLGNHVVTGSRDRTIRFWKETGNQWQSTSVVAHTGAVRCVQVSPDGRQTLSASDDKSIKVRSACYSPDNQLIVSGGDDRTVKLWDVRSKQCIHTYTEHAGTVMSVGFHPSGVVIAGTGVDRTINLWDCRTHTLLQHYPSAHDNTICSLSIHPTGDFLLTASGDTTLKIWDLREGHLFYTLYGHQQPANVAAFSADGSSFASGGADNLVLLWHTNFDQLLSDEVDKTADRLMTMDETMHPSHPQFRPSLYQNTPGHTLFRSKTTEIPVGSPPWLSDIGKPPTHHAPRDLVEGVMIEKPILSTDFERMAVRQSQQAGGNNWSVGGEHQEEPKSQCGGEAKVNTITEKRGNEHVKTSMVNSKRPANEEQLGGDGAQEQNGGASLIQVVAMLQHMAGQMDTLTAVVSSLEVRLTTAEDHILECMTRLGRR